MKRTTFLVLGTAVIGLAAVVALGVIVVQQRSEVASLQARSPSSPDVTLVASPVPTPVSTPVASSRTSPSPSQTASAFAQLQTETDNFGHKWVAGHPPDTVNVKAGTALTLTAIAQDPLDRPLEYVWYFGDSHSHSIACAWGSATCAWTVPAAPLGPVWMYVAVRAKNGTPRLSAPACFFDDPCDDIAVLPFNVSAA